jgi:small conductance mechanosensitive channel
MRSGLSAVDRPGGSWKKKTAVPNSRSEATKSEKLRESHFVSVFRRQHIRDRALMRTIRSCFTWGTLRCLIVTPMAIVFLCLPLGAQEEAASKEIGTTADAKIPVENLRVLLRPLNQKQLEGEAADWFKLLSEKVTEVGTAELAIKSLGEKKQPDESAETEGEDDALQKQLLDLRSAEAGLIARCKIVAAALKLKGGDVTEAEQYIEAISDLATSVDTSSRWAAMVASGKNWLKSPVGGQLFLKRITLALLIMLIFWIISKYAGRLVGKALGRRSEVSTLLEHFARRMAGGLTLFIGLLMALAALGVSIGPLMAAMGAGGFIIGFALQETLASFASGLMIMIYRPFDVDDYVSVAGVEGSVQEMSLVSTTLLTIDNKVLIIPNKTVWGDTITNYTGRETRRVDLVFGIGYSDDIPKAMAVLKEVATAHESVLSDPALSVEVVELGDSSVNLSCRPWVKTADYWVVYWGLTREVKMRFDTEGISIPFPQRDVHMIGDGD